MRPTRSALLLVTLALPLAAQDKKPAARPATIAITVHPDAKLEVGGKAVAGKESRTFTTPGIAVGKTRDFVVKAVWAHNGYTTITRTRTVTARPGETIKLDLTKADPKQPDDYFIKYIATPPVVVEAMLKLAGVKKGDVVYDLGCGDGRIVVTAVAKYGAKRGVGIDIDPDRVRDSKATAKAAGVGDKVAFRQGDVMKVKDLADATVVCLYLGEGLNAQLAPILKKALKPGARIVSHRFEMGDWEPDKTITVRVGATDRKVYLWTITGEMKDKKERK